ncbi:hypothetical protein MRX96_019509 [Rhipicephalus microplus]
MRQKTGTGAAPKRFRCPVGSCSSKDGQAKLFSSQKLLNQHFFKVHAEKKYSCSKCGKKFGADWLSKHHEATCGTSWLCSCGASYQNREALLTHARRRSHALPFERKRGDACKQKTSHSQPLQAIILPVATQIFQPSLHTETQTNEDLSFEEGTDVLHMETQTSKFLFCDFESVDIETQTPWKNVDFNLDDFVVDSSFIEKKDAESQIEYHQFLASWLCMKIPDGEGFKDSNNMHTQTSGLI